MKRRHQNDWCAKERTPNHPSAPFTPQSLLYDRMSSITLREGVHSEEDGTNHLLPTPVSNLIFSCSQQGGFCKYINNRQSCLIKSLLSEGTDTVRLKPPTDLRPAGRARHTSVENPWERSKVCYVGKLLKRLSSLTLPFRCGVIRQERGQDLTARQCPVQWELEDGASVPKLQLHEYKPESKELLTPVEV